MTTTIQPNEESFDKDSRFLTFVINPNFGFSADEEPWSSLLPELGITAQPSKDLAWIKQTMADHVPDLAFISISDFLRSIAKGDQHYRGFAIATSKFTGTTNLPSVLVVRQDDPAQSFADLEGARYGYINKSCSSSYFPANIVLAKQGKRLDEYVNIVQVKPWQGQIDQHCRRAQTCGGSAAKKRGVPSRGAADQSHGKVGVEYQDREIDVVGGAKAHLRLSFRYGGTDF